MSFVAGFFDKIPSKLPIQTLTSNDVPVNFVDVSGTDGAIIDKDDKYITLSMLSNTSNILDELSKHASILKVKTMTQDVGNMLLVRTSPEILDRVNIGQVVRLQTLYICLVQRGNHGIVFLLSNAIKETNDNLISHEGSKIRRVEQLIQSINMIADTLEGIEKLI
eukprot:TRINITY_DN1028_c0_g1_i1.p1 TRINITY_DN1028_c0_g1~~TRINITY_DN1028_c0_g1_i1.p1  ORF type:complete len:165 (-),score=16.87 TRINITY_DN1028_c0_g1_i1:429-923(-)